MNYILDATVEELTDKYVKGYARYVNDHEQRLTVEIYSGNTLLGSVLADQFDDNLIARGKGDGHYSFIFNFPPDIKNLSNISVKLKGTDFVLPLTHKIKTVFYIRKNTEILKTFSEEFWNNSLNFAFCIDKNYFQHFLVVLISILKNHKKRNVIIHLIYENLEIEDFQVLERISNKYKFFLNLIDLTGKIDIKNVPVSRYYSQAIYFRLLIPELLPGALKKVLFLDADVMLNGNIEKIFDIDIDNYYAAAVEDEEVMLSIENTRKRLLMSDTANYFNAGILMINTKKWRQNSLKEKCVNFIDKNFYRMYLNDQDVLNSVINGNWYPLDPKYNLQKVFYMQRTYKSAYSDADYKESKLNPLLIHYVSVNKPWHFLNSHPFKELYWKYLYEINIDICPPETLR